MNPINLQGDAKFLFFTMMNAAIRMKELGKKEKDYLDFAKGIWESLEMNNPETLSALMYEDMMGQIKNYVK
ncbi:MAG TPA: hypothetical protein VFE71_06720 [Bacteroidales bacterium]|nr:hypothetical protein [Bacteroidales bacterium]